MNDSMETKAADIGIAIIQNQPHRRSIYNPDPIWNIFRRG
jgi:hypothetical protein